MSDAVPTSRSQASRAATLNRPMTFVEKLGFVCLLSGIASWVPWIVVFTAPISLFFGLLAAALSIIGRQPGSLHTAKTGLLLTLISVLIQGGFVLIAGGIGLASS